MGHRLQYRQIVVVLNRLRLLNTSPGQRGAGQFPPRLGWVPELRLQSPKSCERCSPPQANAGGLRVSPDLLCGSGGKGAVGDTHAAGWRTDGNRSDALLSNWRRRADSNRCIRVLQTLALTTWQRRPLVPRGGFEPPRAYAHHPLKMACLPGSTTSAVALTDFRQGAARLEPT